MDVDEPAAETDFPCRNAACERRFDTPQGRSAHERGCPHRPWANPASAAPTPAPESAAVAARRAELEEHLRMLDAKLNDDPNLDETTPAPPAVAAAVSAFRGDETSSGNFIRFAVPPNIEAANVEMTRAEAANAGRSAAKAGANGPKLELEKNTWNKNLEEFTQNFTAGVKAVFRVTGEHVTLREALTWATDNTKREHCFKGTKSNPATNLRRFVKHLLAKNEVKIFAGKREIEQASQVAYFIPQIHNGQSHIKFRPKAGVDLI